ncbi:MAG: GNAT family N-acetyltransferase [Acidimicrobiales bacterium]|nr:GNAT family N-acetyltransferase [Acidimicrobiales bacterium]
MRARILAVANVTAADQMAWSELSERSSDPNAFFAPECLLTAHRHLPEAAGLTLAVVEEDGRWLACLPFALHRWRLQRRALVVRCIPGAMGLGTPLIDESGGLEAAVTLLAGLREHRRDLGSGLVVCEWLADGPAANNLRRAAAHLGLTVSEFYRWERAFLRRKDGDDGYWSAALSKDRRRKLAQQRRRLADGIGPLELVDRAGDQAAVKEFLRLEASGWKGVRSDGQAFGRRPQSVDFFHELCERFTAEGRLSLLSFEAGGRPVAMLCCLRAGQGMFTYRIGHDESLAQYSPGIQAFMATLEHFYQKTDAAWIDSSTTPENRYTRTLFPDTVPLATTIIGVGGIDRLFAWGLPVVRDALQRVRPQTDS